MKKKFLFTCLFISNLFGSEDNMLIEASGETDIEIVNKLIKSGFDLDLKGYVGDTALMRASRNCRLENVQALIKAGANINLKNEFGDTALIIAARTLAKKDIGCSILYELLMSGSDKKISNKRGENFYTFLKDSKVKTVFHRYLELKIKKKYKGEINIPDIFKLIGDFI